MLCFSPRPPYLGLGVCCACRVVLSSSCATSAGWSGTSTNGGSNSNARVLLKRVCCWGHRKSRACYAKLCTKILRWGMPILRGSQSQGKNLCYWSALKLKAYMRKIRSRIQECVHKTLVVTLRIPWVKWQSRMVKKNHACFMHDGCRTYVFHGSCMFHWACEHHALCWNCDAACNRYELSLRWVAPRTYPLFSDLADPRLPQLGAILLVTMIPPAAIRRQQPVRRSFEVSHVCHSCTKVLSSPASARRQNFGREVSKLSIIAIVCDKAIWYC